MPKLAPKDFPVWEQGASRVLYCLASCVHDQMFGYIQDANPEGGMGKSKEEFRRKYHDSEVVDLPRAQQYPIEGYVSDRLQH